MTHFRSLKWKPWMRTCRNKIFISVASNYTFCPYWFTVCYKSIFKVNWLILCPQFWLNWPCWLGHRWHNLLPNLKWSTSVLSISIVHAAICCTYALCEVYYDAVTIWANIVFIRWQQINMLRTSLVAFTFIWAKLSYI